MDHEKMRAGGQHRPAPSTSDLLTSAKIVAGAAKATLQHEKHGEKVDMGKVAGAAADLLDAASHYGKLEGKSYGKYVYKAEEYLHTYQSSHSSSTTTTTTTSSHSTSYNTGGASSATGHHVPTSGHTGNHGGKDEDGGFGDYLKLAQGLLKKH